MFNLFDSNRKGKVTQIIDEVKSESTPKTRGGYQRLILKLAQAQKMEKSESESQNLEQLLDTLCSGYIELSKQYVSFLDYPFEEREEFYAFMALRGGLRDICHLGELLLMREDKMGVRLILSAAAEGDVRAVFIAAKILAYGMFDSASNPAKAKELLAYAARKEYAPALELLAALCWDGDGNWDFPRDRDMAQACINKAVEIYAKYKFGNSKLQAAYEEHCKCIKYIANKMEQLRDGGLERLYPGFYPSYLALKLSFYPLTEEGLRSRAHCICEFMAHYGQTFYLGDYYWQVKLPLISLSIEEPNDSYLGMATTMKEGDTVRFHITVAPSMVQRTTTEKTFWQFQLQVNSTLAHELAHCFLMKEYNNQLFGKEPDKVLIREGHATNCQYQFTRLTYYKGLLTPEDFAKPHAYLSRDYSQYFLIFRANFIDSDDLLNWDKLTAAINHVSDNVSRHQVRQVPNKGVYEIPQFCGMGFNGYV